MKWTAIIVGALVMAQSVSADNWVHFQACGLIEPPGPGVALDDAYIERTRLAPHIGPVWIWVPSIQAVIGFTEKNNFDGMLRCTLIYSGANRILVVGTLQEVVNKLESARR